MNRSFGEAGPVTIAKHGGPLRDCFSRLVHSIYCCVPLGLSKAAGRAFRQSAKVKSEYAVWRIWTTALTAFLVCMSISAQSTPTPSTTVRVHGTIRASTGSIVPRAEVTFKSEQVTKTVFSDSRGSYAAQLPVGAYTMTASWAGVEKYRRPLFRAASPKTIVLDVILYPPLRSCDPGSIIVSRPDGTTENKTVGTADDRRDECGGWDRFPIFSGEDGSFELFVRYFNRRRTDGERHYDGGFRNPVLVTFNLFTLTADHVTYDMGSRTLLASGNVTTTDGAGASTGANSMKFRIAKDSVLRLPYGKMKLPK
jgi:hypothetical protein